MVKQKEIRLDQPIDHNAPPTIYGTKLTPSLSNAALNLTIDFIRQKQSQANQHIFMHPLSVLLILLASFGFGYWKVGWIYEAGGWELLKSSRDEIFSILVFITMFTSITFTALTKSTNFIKTTSERLVDDNEGIFGVSLKTFANLNPDSNDKKTKNLLTKGDNTQIIIYRDSPIAVLSLVPKPELSNGEEKFVTKITGCGVRKVYYKSGIIEDLIDWSVYRSQSLNVDKAKKLIVLIDVMSVDTDLKKKLTEKNFKFIEKTYYNNSILLKAYGIYNEVWGLNLNVSSLEESKLEEIEAKPGATGIEKK